MSDLTLTKIRLRNGAWEGRLTGAPTTGKRPDIRVTHLDQPVPDVELVEGTDSSFWTLTIPVPDYAIADGVQTFLIVDGETETKLGDFTLIAGESVPDDLRAEVELLRAELDMLKRAFRRHCLETS
ncbi:hypothetical protein KQ247_08205 [Ruegeria pomeroyi]|jgi:hypothetical protein|nr:hypothetical protein [Ruegeria pomeroyi]NVK99505.1 hypothetical protein [Ruegeria pomeroyi]NVL03233.1 hypothetical protein [Ruegeria pomeroyi]QWV10553.1 hypothetical protein KQ247_08205 [Ruegeria pomeroyi]HCE71073.1 hypothetical protein [Ruegeria sp.]